MKYLLYIYFLIFTILFFAYINSINYEKESFTPLVRPLIRNTRLVAEGFYDKATDNVNKSSRSINNFFARLGLV